jgi:hypothetical protein
MKNKAIRIVLAALIFGIAGFIVLLKMRDETVPLNRLRQEYPTVKYSEAIDSEVAEVYCPPNTRCPGITILIRMTNNEKRTIAAVYDLTDSVKLQNVLKLGSKVIKNSNSDTLFVYETSNQLKQYSFVMKRSLMDKW